jgi:hypothetical protein
VIVASILAAFALDAWWSDRVEDRQMMARLETVRDEFTATRAQLVREGELLESARAAVAALPPHISPTATIIALDSVTALMDWSALGGWSPVQLDYRHDG